MALAALLLAARASPHGTEAMPAEMPAPNFLPRNVEFLYIGSYGVDAKKMLSDPFSANY